MLNASLTAPGGGRGRTQPWETKKTKRTPELLEPRGRSGPPTLAEGGNEAQGNQALALEQPQDVKPCFCYNAGNLAPGKPNACTLARVL